jgi:xanthine dehydrogenase molybdopterin-binding subunit B
VEADKGGVRRNTAPIAIARDLWGVVSESVAYARIKSIDISKAERCLGKGCAHRCRCGAAHRPLNGDTPVLADGVVRFIGEKVAAVAASKQAAEAALERRSRV